MKILLKWAQYFSVVIKYLVDFRSDLCVDSELNQCLV